MNTTYKEFTDARDYYLSEFNKEELLKTFQEFLDEAGDDKKTLVMLAFGQGIKLGSNWAYEWCKRKSEETI